MRDFRVTTIFEGTTEIHSMYPALSLLRALAKKPGKNSRGIAGRFIFLAGGMLSTVFIRQSWGIRFQDKELKRLLRFAKTTDRQIRFLLHAGLLLYGKISPKAVFLKGLHAQPYLYGSISALAGMNAPDGPEEISRRALAVFLEDALRYKRQNGFFIKKKTAVEYTGNGPR
jgi:acyl-CoA dehydrogenase family protein 9